MNYFRMNFNAFKFKTFYNFGLLSGDISPSFGDYLLLHPQLYLICNDNNFVFVLKISLRGSSYLGFISVTDDVKFFNPSSLD